MLTFTEQHILGLLQLISMGTSISRSLLLFLRFFIGFSAFLCLILCSLAEGENKTHLHTIEVKSLLPAATCSPSPKGHNNNKASVLKVVHRHGPCNQLRQRKPKSSTTDQDEDLTQILKQDEARVGSIHSRFKIGNKTYGIPEGPLKQSDATVIPAQSGTLVGYGNYMVSIGLGSPKKELALAFDTGSDITWTQCQPCVRYCYPQRDPIFDPSLSTSYSNISCNSAACSQLAASGVASSCSASTCIYGERFGDGSFTIGFWAKEKLTLTSTNVFNGFVFGCGQNNQGLFRGIAGLLGLGRSNISIVEQTADKYKRFFSYCLPSTSSSTGYLSFGKAGGKGLRKTVKFTPLTTLSLNPGFYGLRLVGINVGGRQLSISSSIFMTPGTIIDSGTVITRLPAKAYAALRGAFRAPMKRYPSANSTSTLLDTCYDFSRFQTVSYPKIGFVFGGGVTVDVDAAGIFFQQSASRFCLAFAGNKNDRDIGIIGNVQQKRLHVVYDVARGKVGFAPAGCS